METSDLKFLIILAYYKRPIMVKNALDSIKNLTYDNWKLVFLDDSGDNSFENDLYSFGLDNSKVEYIAIEDSEEKKTIQGGSAHGGYMNNIIKETDCDVVVIVCDDDALHKDYFTLLNSYYKSNPQINWSYCKVFYYDPETEFYSESGDKTYTNFSSAGSTYNMNQWDVPMNPYHRIDSSQLTFRKSLFISSGAEYPSPQTRGLDAALIEQFVRSGALCYPNRIYGQYKGAFKDQLGNRNKNDFDTIIK